MYLIVQEVHVCFSSLLGTDWYPINGEEVGLSEHKERAVHQPPSNLGVGVSFLII